MGKGKGRRAKGFGGKGKGNTAMVLEPSTLGIDIIYDTPKSLAIYLVALQKLPAKRQAIAISVSDLRGVLGEKAKSLKGVLEVNIWWKGESLFSKTEQSKEGVVLHLNPAIASEIMEAFKNSKSERRYSVEALKHLTLPQISLYRFLKAREGYGEFYVPINQLIDEVVGTKPTWAKRRKKEFLEKLQKDMEMLNAHPYVDIEASILAVIRKGRKIEGVKFRVRRKPEYRPNSPKRIEGELKGRFIQLLTEEITTENMLNKPDNLTDRHLHLLLLGYGYITPASLMVALMVEGMVNWQIVLEKAIRFEATYGSIANEVWLKHYRSMAREYGEKEVVEAVKFLSNPKVQAFSVKWVLEALGYLEFFKLPKTLPFFSPSFTSAPLWARFKRYLIPAIQAEEAPADIVEEIKELVNLLRHIERPLYPQSEWKELVEVEAEGDEEYDFGELERLLNSKGDDFAKPKDPWTIWEWEDPTEKWGGVLGFMRGRKKKRNGGGLNGFGNG